MYPLDDTIAAVSSPPGGAARGIVRLSGPGVRKCVEKVFRADGQLPDPAFTRSAVIAGALVIAGITSPLPCELYLWPDRRSYTGQPVAELHTLGSPPLLDAVLRCLCTAGARMAEPGEFTLRAFLAGRIDLTEAEAVLGVIDAADAGELDVALAQLAGGLARPLHELREALVDLLAHLEAGFDFADEDLPFITPDQLHRQLDDAAGHVEKLARQMDARGETVEMVRAVLIGRPNTGKSSLFNALARRTGALVSEHPGTTRDYLTAELDLGGVKCQLVDTAGFEAGLAGDNAIAESFDDAQNEDVPDDVRKAARAAAKEQKRRSGVCILCLDSARPLDVWERDQLASGGGERIVVWTKTDLPRQSHLTSHVLETSAVTGQGIHALRDELRRAVLTAASSPRGAVAGTAVRCRESLRLAAESLCRAKEVLHTNGGEELVAAEIRVALGELGKVVGAVYTDDVLDRIFSRFCIGK
ncbi:MAG TPA: tRNA modification GTPase [Thermoguttaceae bacterium]|nr:tRNA modification GTPase [Thermoguttaceae bacterium]